MSHELRIHCHHVFDMTMDWAVLDHPDLAIALDDLRFDFADLLAQEHGHVFFPTKNILARLNDAVRAKRICRSRPTQTWFRFLPRFQQWLVLPFWRKVRVWRVTGNQLY